MGIAIVGFPGCDVKKFEINLVFEIKPFFCMGENLGQNIKYLKVQKELLR